ncbi:TrbI F-type domain-containing protein [Novosphingobium pokkalii]|uniref:TrbI F-type domain-containing protein n=1 Tax=Novosphingobium pokkalii TaxID=1770194 RepID=UPI003635E121
MTTIRKVALADLVRDYVQAEARSGATPDQITAETSAYIKALNLAVARHAAQGEILLLSNAVVAGDVPDITPRVRDEVTASLAKPALSQSPAAQMQQFFDAKGADHGSSK